MRVLVEKLFIKKGGEKQRHAENIKGMMMMINSLYVDCNLTVKFSDIGL
jgi:hypothetical protein